MVASSAEDRVVLHLDMDAFYASIEQREDPSLRGEPVIVGADPEEGEGRGVVAAASYEARAYGVHSAQPITRAWRNCPEGIYLRPRFDVYEAESEQVFAIVENAVDVLEPVSIDEAYADVTDRVDGDWAAARRLAEAIGRRIASERGLTCSIGIGPNKLVAKIAADEDKPDGLTLVRPDEGEAFLAPKPADVIPGVGPKTDDALADMGIETVADLAAREPDEMEARFGAWGPRMVAFARGRDERPVTPERERKSVGAESTFREDVAPGRARQRLGEVAEEAVRRLEAAGGQGRTIAVKVRLRPFETFTRQRTLPAPTDDADVVDRIARDLFDEIDVDRPVRLVGVRIASLVDEEARQVTLDRWPTDVAAEGLGEPAWERDDYWRF
jgi:nucleotidyltransferase/DNA polymerase involved in DNA repair